MSVDVGRRNSNPIDTQFRQINGISKRRWIEAKTDCFLLNENGRISDVALYSNQFVKYFEINSDTNRRCMGISQYVRWTSTVPVAIRFLLIWKSYSDRIFFHYQFIILFYRFDPTNWIRFSSFFLSCWVAATWEAFWPLYIRLSNTIWQGIKMRAFRSVYLTLWISAQFSSGCIESVFKMMSTIKSAKWNERKTS